MVLLVIVIIIAGLVYFLIPRSGVSQDIIDEDAVTPIEVACTEGAQKLSGTNILSCVGGEWQYIGNLNNESKG